MFAQGSAAVTQEGRASLCSPLLLHVNSRARTRWDPLRVLSALTLISSSGSGIPALSLTLEYCFRQCRMAFMYYRAADSGHKDVYAALPLINVSLMFTRTPSISLTAEPE